jgi:hypothetical protein
MKATIHELKATKLPIFSFALFRLAVNNSTTPPPTCHGAAPSPPWFSSPFVMIILIITILGIFLIGYYLLKRKKALNSAYKRSDIPEDFNKHE